MSCYSNLYTSEANVNAYLEQILNSDEIFQKEELSDLRDYQKMASSGDYEFLLLCAQQAALELKNQYGYSNAHLTEYGIVLKHFIKDGFWHNDAELIKIQKKYVDELVKANKKFAELWKQKREENEKRRGELQTIQKEVNDEIGDLLQVITVKEIVKGLEKEEFTVTNMQEIYETPPMKIFTEGIIIRAQHKKTLATTEVHLFMAGGNYSIHTDEHKDPAICKEMGTKVAEIVANSMRKSSMAAGVPVAYSTATTPNEGVIISNTGQSNTTQSNTIQNAIKHS